MLGGAVSIGNFDGVHHGHACLLKNLKLAAKQVNGPAVVVTFDPHPAAVLRPQAVPARLTSLERRAELLQQQGVDFVVVCRVDRDFLNRSAEAFFQSTVLESLQAAAIVEGPNFFFGRNREGDTKRLETLCRDAGIGLTIVPATAFGEQMISSSRVRQSLLAGDIAAANSMLTAPYQLTGKVGTGEQRGRLIGFPTANLVQPTSLVPVHGVYATSVRLDGQVYRAATHIGPNPTFGESVEKIEVHLLDWSGDLYGRDLSVDFIEHVRDIASFESVDILRQQLQRDVQKVRSLIHIGK